MLAIRLQRVGRKNDPSFRVIVADSKLKPKTGNVLEILGSYNARHGKPIINTERATYWMSVGAKASGTVHNILVDLKAVTGKKINVLNKKTPIIKETPKEEVKEVPAVVKEVPKAVEEALVVSTEEVITETPVEAPKEETPA